MFNKYLADQKTLIIHTTHLYITKYLYLCIKMRALFVILNIFTEIGTFNLFSGRISYNYDSLNKIKLVRNT